MTPQVLSQAVTRQVTQFIREFARARRGIVRGVHQSRVASRRLREGLGALNTVLPKQTRRRASQVLRELACALGAVRECDVTLALTATQAREHGWPSGSAVHLTSALRRERRRRHRRLMDVQSDIDWRASLHQVRRRAGRIGEAPDWRSQVTTAARARRHHRARALVAGLRDVGALYVPDQLHALRIATKKLRYALEWESQIGLKAWVRERRALAAAQEELGVWHDLLILQQRLNRLRRAGGQPRLILGDFTNMAAQLERECRARHAAILAALPRLTRVAEGAAR